MLALVTGGAGFIGSHLVDALVDRGADAIVFDDLSSGRRENVNPAARFIQGDIVDKAAVEAAAAGCDIVFHEAARRAVLQSVEHPLETDRVNIAGTLTVLMAARDAGVRRVVFGASSSVYGGTATLPTPESAPPNPRSPYAVTKYAGEQYCRVFSEMFGVETFALRYFNVYGPRQRPDSRYAAVIPLFLDAVATGRPPEVHGDGEQSRHFTFVSDAVNANLGAAEASSQCSGRVYNVAGPRSHTLLEVLDILGDVLGARAEPIHTSPRAGDIRHSLADLSAARRDLGYEPVVELSEGLRLTAELLVSSSDGRREEPVGD
ncbi:MAG TPA: NAD-dependent epimerase/dehydratase family protein [Acidimicrobiia bacterium]|nr:NAD-dependent epimerase/dehydratase family protein [Acidimicrobiia bacterium]